MITNQSPREISIFRDSYTISIESEMLNQIGGPVVVPKRVPRDDFVHGYDVCEILESPFDGRRIPNLGLLEYLAYLARNRGVRLREIATTPIVQLGSPVFQNQLKWPHWIDFVHRQTRGLVHIYDDADIPEMIAELVVAYPQNRIMVFGRVTNLKKHFKRLLKLVPNEVRREKQLALVHGGRSLRQFRDREIPRLIFCTPTAAADLDSEKCDIVVMLDAFECLHESMQWPLIQVDARFRLFGLLSSRRRPKLFEEAQLRLTFGFRQLHIKNNGRVRRQVAYIFVPFHGRAPDGTIVSRHRDEDGRDNKIVDSLAAFVHHHCRSDMIARLAKKLRDGRPLPQSCFQEVAAWRTEYGRSPLSIMIVVDRLDHAVRLGKMLPHWPIITERCNLSLISPNSLRQIKARPTQWTLCQIVVTDVASTVAGHFADIVIWASGGIAADVPESWMYTRNHPGRPMLVVDFRDEFSIQTSELSRKRQEDLEERGIFRVGTPEVIGHLQRFEKMQRGWQ